MFFIVGKFESCFLISSFSGGVGEGGLLTLWDNSEMEVWSSFSLEHVLIIHGRCIRTNEVFYLFNVYVPCDLRAKQELWTSLSERFRY